MSSYFQIYIEQIFINITHSPIRFLKILILSNFVASEGSATVADIALFRMLRGVPHARSFVQPGFLIGTCGYILKAL